MRRIIQVMLLSALVVAPFLLTSCDMVQDIRTVRVMLTERKQFATTHSSVPCVKEEFVDLQVHDAYREYRSKIEDAEFVDIAINVRNYAATNSPSIDDAVLSKVSFSIRFENESEEFKLAEFRNVRIKDFYLKPQIMKVAAAEANRVARLVKNRPRFYLIQRIDGVTSGEGRFDSFALDAEVSVALETKL